MVRVLMAVTFVVLAGGPAMALCTNEMASAKAQEFARLLKGKMASDPDAAGELADQFGEIMSAGSVTEQTCARFDVLLTKARLK